MMAGIDMIHVPYRGGGQVMTDLIAGQVQVSFIGLTVAMEHIRGGKVHALAVTTATRSDVLPDIPTVGDLIGDCDPDEWDLPPKPKWMRWRTYNRYVERYDRYEDILERGIIPLIAKFLGRSG
jgi:Tripartite tricarboxylate transporter family receptor